MKKVTTKRPPLVYLPMAVDVIHHGHVNIINEARKFGPVTVGLLTDQAIANYKRVPLSTYEERKRVIENIVGVHAVIPQETDDYVPMIKRLKPDVFVHGDDWKTGIQAQKRKRVIEVMRAWGGKVVEPAYTKGVSSTRLIEQISKHTSPDKRRGLLRRILSVRPLVRVVDVHNGFTGTLVERAKRTSKERVREFDGMWLSPTVDALAKGKTLTSYVNIASLQATIDEVFDVTSKFLIVDAGTGGPTDHLSFAVSTFERLGVSAIVLRESRLLRQQLRSAKVLRTSEACMIFACLDEAEVKQGVAAACKRAKAYLDAGADGIMIDHTLRSSGTLVAFCRAYQRLGLRAPLAVQSSCAQGVTEDLLLRIGVRLAIYPNYLLQAAQMAMEAAARDLLASTSR